MSLSDEIEELEKARQDGLLSDEEFARAKGALLKQTNAKVEERNEGKDDNSPRSSA